MLLTGFILVEQATLAGGSSPPANKTLSQISAESTSKRLAKKISDKANDMSRELWEGKRSDPEQALKDFIAWLSAEVGEAYDVGHDYTNLVQSAKIVFSSACVHSKEEYSKGWSVFLQIVLKYAASIACAYIEPIFLPPVCFVVGSIVGKYAGAALGSFIHDHACGRKMDFAAIRSESDKIIEAVEPYNTNEWIKFKEAIGK